MATKPNSHVTTRRLTKPWEGSERNLYYYDFARDSFHEESSRTLLTADNSFGYNVERFLNETVESHLANHLDALSAGTFIGNIPWNQGRAGDAPAGASATTLHATDPRALGHSYTRSRRVWSALFA
jgi:hypothetical protein